MIKSPVLIIGCARSGTTLLYSILSEVPSLWSIGRESKAIIERYHHPSVKNWESGALSAADLTAESRDWIPSAFSAEAAPGRYWQRVNQLRSGLRQNHLYRMIKARGRTTGTGSAAGSALPESGLAAFRALARMRRRLTREAGAIRLVEKTPENCLRLPFLAQLFPDARIIFLVRDGRANVYSLLEGWRQPHLFAGYATPIPVNSPGQNRGRWAFTLIPGWRDLVDRPLEEICARQWVACNAAVLDYTATPGALPLLKVGYEDLVANPNEVLAGIARFLQLDPESIPRYGRTLPVINAVSHPHAEKWRAEAAVIHRVTPTIAPMMGRLGYGV